MGIINLLYLSIGSGHQMAARAIGEAIRLFDPGREIDVYDPLVRKVPFFDHLATIGLAWSMRYGGQRYDTHWKKGDVRITGWAASQPWVMQSTIKGDVVVATHVFALQMAHAYRKRYGKIRKVFGVPTDFGLHGYWPVKDVDGYFVADEDLCNELVRRGVPSEKVKVSGIPLRLAFTSTGIWQPRRLSGPLRVLILAGGLSSGAYLVNLAWFQELFDSLRMHRDEVRFTIITGNRKQLLVDLERMSKEKRFEIYPRGLVGDMAEVMRSHDLLIGKPGGATVAESLACGLPMAAMKPGPGQESANRGFLERKGVWIEAFTPIQVAAVITRAVKDEQWLFEMSRRCKCLGKPDAALDIARALLKEAC